MGRLPRVSSGRIIRGAVAVVVLVASVAGVAIYLSSKKSVAYQTAVVSKGPVLSTVTLAGTISPAVSDSVTPPSAGVVTAIPVTLGQSVSAGQVLAQIAPTANYSAQIALAQANLAQAEATLSDAQAASVATTTTTSPTPTTSTSLATQINQAIASLEASCSAPTCSAQSQIAALKALFQKYLASSAPQSSPTGSHSPQPSIPSASVIAADQAIISADAAALSRLEASVPSNAMVSPVAGVVASVPISLGEHVNSTAQYAVVVIVPSSWVATANVPATDLPSIHPGDAATIFPAGMGARTGTVSAIGSTATVNATTGSTTFPVSLSIDGGPSGLFDGASATITIQTAHVDNVLRVPTSALINNGGRTEVDLLSPSGVSTPVAVQIGVVGADATQIVSGLRVGESVILADLATPLPTPTTRLGLLRRSFLGGGGGGGGRGRAARAG